MNNVILIGRLTKDADLKYTSSGKAVATFTLAVDKYSNGEKSADFIGCVVWEKSAEALANYTKKGSKIAVRGSINTRNYENQQGQRVYVTEVVADKFNGIEFLDSKSDNHQSNNQSSNTQSNQGGQQGSFPGVDPLNKGTDPFGSVSQIDISDDDLPF